MGVTGRPGSAADEHDQVAAGVVENGAGDRAHVGGRLSEADAAGGQTLILRLDVVGGECSPGNAGVVERLLEFAGRDGRVVDRLQERSEEHTSELQSRPHLVCRLLLEKKKNNKKRTKHT